MNIHRLTLCIILCLASIAAAAQISAPTLPDEVGTGRIPGARGYYYTDIDGEEVKMIVLNDVVVYPPLKFKNKKEEEFYWRTVRDVKKTLPYAKLICATLLETYEYIETFPTQKEREDYLKAMESAIFKQYKPVLKKFTKSQAQMLIKLIKRETNQNSYSHQSFSWFFPRRILADIRPFLRREPQRRLPTRKRPERCHN